MNNLMIRSAGEPTMSSREIAQLVESRHADVCRSIERLMSASVIGRYAPTAYTHEQNGQQYQEYLIGKRDSYVVVAQLSPEFTARLVDRWQELEQQAALAAIPQTLPEALRLAADLAEENQRIAAERDRAIQTKAQISSSREASVMGKLSAAARKVKKLEQELGRNAEQATVIAVEKAAGIKLGKQGFRPLKTWCKDNGVTPSRVPCPRYGEVVAWPAAAWLACHNVDLAVLFGGAA